MGDIRVLFKNADGFDQDHSPSTDSVQFLSFKTANKELTDTKLSHLIDGVDASDEHIHDLRYYRRNEHITTSSGANDANKPTNVGPTGKFSNTLIDVPGLNALLSHSALTNLTADDHLQYLRTDGTRNITGLLKYDVLVSVTDDKAVPTKKYVDDAILTANLGQEWYDSVITRIINPPASPATGARYLIDSALGTPTGVWTGKSNQVATWNGTGYTYQIPQQGTFVSVDNEPTALYNFGGTTWTAKYFETTTASTGVVKVGNDLQLDPGVAGNGLAFSAGVLNVNVDGTGLEINADTLRLKALGVKAANIDFGTGANQVSGVNVPLADAGTYFATKNVEAALQYLAGETLAQGQYYTVGAGGVTKGQLLYVSAADTVLPLTNITANNYCIGVANTTASAGQLVKVLANDTVCKGVLSSASAGTRYYWVGNGYSASQPIALGANVWSVGVAKNATDLQIEVENVKKNSLL